MGVRVSAIVAVYLGVGIREEIEDSARILITCCTKPLSRLGGFHIASSILEAHRTAGALELGSMRRRGM